MTRTPAVPTCVLHPVIDGAQADTSTGQRLGQDISSLCQTAKSLGFHALLLPAPTGGASDFPSLIDHPDHGPQGTAVEVLRAWQRTSADQSLSVLIDVDPTRVRSGGEFAGRWPHAYRSSTPGQALDPRLSPEDAATALLRVEGGRMDPALLDDWANRLDAWAACGIAGFRLANLKGWPLSDIHALVDRVRRSHPDIVFIGDTPGLAAEHIDALRGSDLDALTSSLPWWDFRSPWLAEEDARLRQCAPAVVATADLSADPDRAESAIWAAAVTGDVLLVRVDVAHESLPSDTLRAAVAWHVEHRATAASYRIVTGPASGLTAVWVADAYGFTDSTHGAPDHGASLLLINPDNAPIRIQWDILQSRLGGGYGVFEVPGTDEAPQRRALPELLGSRAALLTMVRRAASVVRPATADAKSKELLALSTPRIAIENVSPVVDDGRFPLKTTIGESVTVQADVFMDGHDRIAVELQWRAVDEIGWHGVPMVHLGNDRYAASFAAQRVGRHEFKVRAWRDAWATFHNELSKKYAAGLDVKLEVEEGRLLVAEALAQLPDGEAEVGDALRAVLTAVGAPSTASPAPGYTPSRNATIPPMQPAHIELLLADATAQAMAASGHYPFLSESEGVYPVSAERQAARFASWYELFPRSQSGSTDVHGTFADVMTRLPAIRDMGFDVLYFPPIHPIGLSNRKGKNNTLNAGADQPGSPYAIGSADGGHADVHPELGTLEDFHALIAAAHAHGLEIALDFAIQCSPDHPWLADSPDWFTWRADGTMRYAENPPKRYEDIVNVDFYSFGADRERQSALWRALRDVIMFWVENGVRTFRVDNPHTKPLPFWEWMIGEVQARYPDTLFLSEAFTRPKMMYRLAKVGFSQSYTYFTWREHKQEFIDYLEELNRPPASQVFRPNFFVNTPDINPVFLQRSGRAGFLIRMALATTTSGLWGMYSGFELCEAQPMPGKEEYLDSEKYEIRAWDWQRPGNIIAEMTAMNLIRRRNPALQNHLGFHAETIFNDKIILFTKATPERDNVLLVAVNMDPFNVQSGSFELPLWSFGLPDDAALNVTDLLTGHAATWHGKMQHLTLSPDAPYAVWRLDGPALRG